MPEILPAKFCHMGYPAALRRADGKAGWQQYNNKYFRLQPEFRRRRHIEVTVCNVPLQLDGDVLAAYTSAYGSVEETTSIRSVDGTAHGNNVFNICMNRENSQAVPHILTYQEQQMMVVVEGRRPLCWSCKQIGHLARTHPTTVTSITAIISTRKTPVPPWNLGTKKKTQKKDGPRLQGRRDLLQKPQQKQHQ